MILVHLWINIYTVKTFYLAEKCNCRFYPAIAPRFYFTFLRLSQFQSWTVLSKTFYWIWTDLAWPLKGQHFDHILNILHYHNFHGNKPVFRLIDRCPYRGCPSWKYNISVRSLKIILQVFVRYPRYDSYRWSHILFFAWGMIK